MKEHQERKISRPESCAALLRSGCKTETKVVSVEGSIADPESMFEAAASSFWSGASADPSRKTNRGCSGAGKLQDFLWRRPRLPLVRFLPASPEQTRDETGYNLTFVSTDGFSE